MERKGNTVFRNTQPKTQENDKTCHRASTGLHVGRVIVDEPIVVCKVNRRFGNGQAWNKALLGQRNLMP
jgi:hypothetical protein